MAATALRFSQQLPASTALRFGAQAQAPTTAVSLVLGLSWGDGQPAGAQARAPWVEVVITPVSSGGTTLPWGPMQALGSAPVVTPWGVTPSAGSAPVRAPWGEGRGLGAAPLRAPWGGRLSPSAAGLRAPWGVGRPAGAQARAPWGEGRTIGRTAAAPWGAGRTLHLRARAPWGPGRPMESVGWPAVVVDVDPSGPVRPDPHHVRLRFEGLMPRRPRLRFGIVIPGRYVPRQRVIMVVNHFELYISATGTRIPCDSASLTLDVSSWCWGFSASCPRDVAGLIDVGTELTAVVNGQQWRVLVESDALERTFGAASLRLTGRGVAARLDAPYFASTTYGNPTGPRTAQQLVAEALPVGWSLDWGIEDWLVPATVWSHSGTPATVASAVAAAAGAYVRPHRTLQQLSVLPRYPVPAWRWGEMPASVDLPIGLVTREGRERQARVAYDAVWVSGSEGGVLRRVLRQGTAGSVVAPLVTDALITADAAARQRGIAVLSDGGLVTRRTWSMPMLQSVGVIEPGTWVDVEDVGGVFRHGLTRSVTIDFRGQADLQQTITVESYEESV